jgi:hypothetical protein
VNFINGFIGVFDSKALGEMAAIALLTGVSIVAIAVFTSWCIKKGGLV